jgi:hypothetical protein
MRKFGLWSLGLLIMACSVNKKSGNADVSFLANGDTNMVIQYIKTNELVYFVSYQNNKPAVNFYSVPGMDSLTEATLYPFEGNEKFFVYYPIQLYPTAMDLHVYTCDSSFSKPIKTLLQRKIIAGEVIVLPKDLGFFKSVLSGTDNKGVVQIYEANH